MAETGQSDFALFVAAFRKLNECRCRDLPVSATVASIARLGYFDFARSATSSTGHFSSGGTSSLLFLLSVLHYSSFTLAVVALCVDLKRLFPYVNRISVSKKA